MLEQIPSPAIFWSAAAATGLLSFGTLLAYSVFVPRCQFWAPVVRGIPQRDAISLTFDDGPDPRFTPRILDILAEHHVKATFFVIGRFAKKYPDLIQRIHAEGHALGNHSLDHDHFGVNRNRAYWQNQIDETQKIVSDIAGEPPYMFRPPMGFKTWNIAAAAKESGLPVVAWSLRAYDTKSTLAPRLAKRVLKRTGGHDIIVFHDGVEPNRPHGSQEETVKALPLILDGLPDKKLAALSLLQAFVTTPNQSAAETVP